MKKLLVSLATLITLFAVVPFALAATPAFTTGNPTTSGLTSYYSFNGGNSNDVFGTNNGADTSMSYGSGYGKIGQGADFNGAAQIAITQFTGTSLTFAGWFYPTSIAQAQQLLIYNISAEPPIQLNWNETGSRFQIDKRMGTVWNSAVSATNLSLNAWYFVVGSYTTTNTSGGTATLSISVNNGTPVVNTYTDASGSYGSSAARIGGSGGNYYSGYMDELFVYSRILTSTEITQLYNSGAGETLCNVAGWTACGGKHKILIISLNWKPEPIA